MILFEIVVRTLTCITMITDRLSAITTLCHFHMKPLWDTSLAILNVKICRFFGMDGCVGVCVGGVGVCVCECTWVGVLLFLLLLL